MHLKKVRGGLIGFGDTLVSKPLHFFRFSRKGAEGGVVKSGILRCLRFGGLTGHPGPSVPGRLATMRMHGVSREAESGHSQFKSFESIYKNINFLAPLSPND